MIAFDMCIQFILIFLGIGSHVRRVLRFTLGWRRPPSLWQSPKTEINPNYLWPTRSQGLFLVSCEYIEDPKNLKLVRYFCLYFLCFDPCPELLHLKYVAKTFYWNTNFSAPKTATWLINVANLRVFFNMHNYVKRLQCE